MIRRVAMLCFALLLVLGGPLTVAAQQSSPVPSDEIGPTVGDAVPWIGAEGSEIATVTVDEIVDPYQDYDPSSAPQRGFHYVLLAVTVANTGARPVNVDPGAIALVDADGFLARYSFLYRTAEDTAANPDLQYAELPPGDTVSGVVAFQVLNGVEVERVVFMPEGTHLITLVDQRPARTLLGTTVSVLGTEGSEVSQVTVDELIDPFEGYDPSSSPDRGNHFVVIAITITNTGTRPVQADPSAFYLVDAEGFIAYPDYLYRADATNPPDFTYTELAPGASQSGIVAFQVLNGSEITAVVYAADDYTQQLIVAEPGEDGWPEPTTRPQPQPTATPAGPTPEPITVSSEECAALVVWAEDLVARIDQLAEVIVPISTAGIDGSTTIDPVAARQAADALIALAEDQRNSNPPPSAERLNTILADAYQQLGEAAGRLADAAEANDDAGVTAAITELQTLANTLFSEDSEGSQIADALTVACPELDNVGID